MKVSAGGSHVEQAIWFTTPPLTKGVIERLQTLQLHTVSHDQGWAGDRNAGSWTWFEISAIRQHTQRRTGWQNLFKRPEVIQSSEPYRCVSHENLISQGEPQNLSNTFGADHELLRSLEPNDRVAVIACARFRGWDNTGLSACLDFQRRFEPRFF